MSSYGNVNRIPGSHLSNSEKQQTNSVQGEAKKLKGTFCSNDNPSRSGTERSNIALREKCMVVEEEMINALTAARQVGTMTSKAIKTSMLTPRKSLNAFRIVLQWV